jgi:hypothetical protein
MCFKIQHGVFRGEPTDVSEGYVASIFRIEGYARSYNTS